MNREDFRKPLIGGETTVTDLISSLRSTKTEYKPLPGFNMNLDQAEYYRLQQLIDCDEVYPKIYIGDATTAKNIDYLKRIGVTHVLNSAEGNGFGFVNTNEGYYKKADIKYLGLPLADRPSADINKYFHAASAFIDDAVLNGGRVFVHCMMGISRSSTCVIAFLMMNRQFLAAEAIRLIRKSRDIQPNEGFLAQLVALDNHLRRQRSKSS